MDVTRVRIWTRTLYAVIHSLKLAHSLGFGRLDSLEQSVAAAADWVQPDCSYNSVLLTHSQRPRGVDFRRDPILYFDEITRQIISMLIQDLVTIADDQMGQIIHASGGAVPNYPFSKAEFLRKKIDKHYDWSFQGCAELIACRNVLTHGGGRWNAESIALIAEFVSPPPQVGDQLSIGFPMLFRFRKAIRTLTSRGEIALRGTEKVPRVKKIREAVRQTRVRKLNERARRKELVREWKRLQ